MNHSPHRGAPFWSIPATPHEPDGPEESNQLHAGDPAAADPSSDLSDTTQGSVRGAPGSAHTEDGAGLPQRAAIGREGTQRVPIGLEDARRVVELLEAGADADPAELAELIQTLGLGGRGVMASEALDAMRRLATAAVQAPGVDPAPAPPRPSGA